MDQQLQEQLSRHQQQLLKKQENETRVKRAQRFKKLRSWVVWLVVILVIGGGIGIIVVGIATQPSLPQEDIISRSGLHWHPQLKIIIKGNEVEIPHNLGIGGVHNPIHTHEDLPTLHLEFQGRVVKDDLRLKKFFELWKKQFSSTCILDSCTGPEGKVSMKVNDKENTEFEQYVMKDKDVIEIRYE